MALMEYPSDTSENYEPSEGETVEYSVLGAPFRLGIVKKIHPSGRVYVEALDGSSGGNAPRAAYIFRRPAIDT
jgi:hypothetical protein